MDDDVDVDIARDDDGCDDDDWWRMNDERPKATARANVLVVVVVERMRLMRLRSSTTLDARLSTFDVECEDGGVRTDVESVTRRDVSSTTDRARDEQSARVE